MHRTRVESYNSVVHLLIVVDLARGLLELIRSRGHFIVGTAQWKEPAAGRPCRSLVEPGGCARAHFEVELVKSVDPAADPREDGNEICALFGYPASVP